MQTTTITSDPQDQTPATADNTDKHYYVPKAVNRQRPNKRAGGAKDVYKWMDQMTAGGYPVEVNLNDSGKMQSEEAYKVMAGRLHQAFHTRREKAKEAGITPPNFVLDYDRDQHRLWVWLVAEEEV